MFPNSKTWVVWNRVVQISFKKDLPAMNAIKKKITWYKYANINKVIRKPPIMKNMPFWKNCSLYILLGKLMLEKEPVSLRPNSRLVSYTMQQHVVYTVYIFCAEIHHKDAQLLTIKMEGWGPRQEKSCLLTPHLWPQEMLLKNLHRRRITPISKGIPSLSNT